MDRVAILIVYDETYENSVGLMDFLKEDQCVESLVRVLPVKHNSPVLTMDEDKKNERLSTLKGLLIEAEMPQKPGDFNYVVFISSSKQNWSHPAKKSESVHINWGLHELVKHTSCGDRLRKRLTEFVRLTRRVTI